MRKVIRHSLLTIVLLLALTMVFTSCMSPDDYYTKDDVLNLTDTLEREINSLELEYNSKVAELEASNKANADALAELKSDYETELTKLQAADSENKTAIENLTNTYNSKVAELEASDKANADALAELKNDYEAKVQSIESLITQLQETNADHTKRIAQLEAQVKAILERHEHTFGEWVNFSGNGQAFCEERLFYRICTECRVLEWKQGSYEDHLFSTETIDPTCVSGGYDKHVCALCRKTYTDNETATVDHDWSEEYSHDNSFHWIDCPNCDNIKDYAEHTTDDTGVCTVCNQQIGTVGIIYDISTDGASAEVIGYEGTATRIVIADEYEGLPVTAIYDKAFVNSKITSVVISDSVTSIGDGAFSGCTSLTSITIPDSVTSIGNSAFYYCEALTSVTIPDSVTSIGDYAFCYCFSLTSITIPDSVTSIGIDAFLYCKALISIEVGDNNKNYMDIDGNLYSKDGTTLIQYAAGKKDASFEIPDSVTSIGNSAFFYCDALTSITIPDSITSIDDYAFYGCSALANIIIPDSVTSIGNSAFFYCDALTSITIPDSVTSIGNSAFYKCSALTNIIIPDSVTSIGIGAFSYCEALISIEVGDNNKNYMDIDGNLYSKDGTTLIQYAAGKKDASFEIPDNVTSIGNSAFYGCSALANIIIPDSVTSIGNSAFYGCSALISIEVGDNNKNYMDIDGNLYSKDGTTLIQYATDKKDTSFEIPDGVEVIDNYAFSGCKSLTSITIPDSVTSIDIAFYGCSSLESVTIGKGITSIGQHAFYGCSALTSITIPDSVTYIGDYAFYNCSAITDVYYTGSEEEWENISIDLYGNSYLTGATIHYNYVPEE